MGSEGRVKLTKAELDELLVEGVDWAIGRGYGWEQDAEVCEEGGKMIGAEPGSVSDIARKRGAPQLGSLDQVIIFSKYRKLTKSLMKKRKSYGH